MLCIAPHIYESRAQAHIHTINSLVKWGVIIVNETNSQLLARGRQGCRGTSSMCNDPQQFLTKIPSFWDLQFPVSGREYTNDIRKKVGPYVLPSYG